MHRSTMKYHPVDFDIDDFLSRIQGNKPPFICPAESCQKVHKSFAHMQKHMQIHRPPAPIDIPASPSEIANHREDYSGTGHVTGNPIYLSSFRQISDRLPLSVNLQKDCSVVFGPSSVTSGQTYRCSVFVPLRVAITSDTEDDMHVGFSANDDVRYNGLKSVPASKSANVGKPSKTNPIEANNIPGQTQPRSKVSVDLPKAVFEVDPEFSYKKPLSVKKDGGFIRFIEKTAEELDEIVEYDLDEEDIFWLERTNKERKQRQLPPISEETLEWTMDRFEKEAKFRYIGSLGHGDTTSAITGSSHSGIDEDAVCAVCQDGTCENTNVILFCDVCNLAVHQECYGVPYVPEGPWLCRKCLHSPSEPVSCVLCPNAGGAFKKTSDDRWAHVICGLWVPEVMFANLTFLEPLEGIDKIAPARWRLQCFICKQRNAGACIQCHKTSCYRAFHVTCAQSAGLYMKIEHTDQPGDLGIRKNAFCDQHCPPNHFLGSNKGMYANSDSESPQSPEQAARIQLRKARKALAERRNSKPSVCVPVVPKAKIDFIASQLSTVSGDVMEYLGKVYGFWKLKREFRRGVPLLKRLQASSIHRTAANFAVAATGNNAEAQNMRAQLKFWQQLRQDLERARLLSELIRKRERAKRDLFKCFVTQTEILVQPFKVFLSRLLDSLQALDKDAFFAEPVGPELAPDYHLIITNPMDFRTMRTKVENCSYATLADLEADFRLMLDNCFRYNRRNSIYYVSATRILEEGARLIDDANSTAKLLGLSSVGDWLDQAQIPELLISVGATDQHVKENLVSTTTNPVQNQEMLTTVTSPKHDKKPHSPLKEIVNRPNDNSVSSGTRSRLRSPLRMPPAEDTVDEYKGYLNPIELPAKSSRKRRLSSGSRKDTTNGPRPKKHERLDDGCTVDHTGDYPRWKSQSRVTDFSDAQSDSVPAVFDETPTPNTAHLDSKHRTRGESSVPRNDADRDGPAFTRYRNSRPVRYEEEDDSSDENDTSEESSSASLSPQGTRNKRQSKPYVRTTLVGKSRMASVYRRKSSALRRPMSRIEKTSQQIRRKSLAFSGPRHIQSIRSVADQSMVEGPKTKSKESSASSGSADHSDAFSHLESPGPLSISTSIEPLEFFPPSLDGNSLPGSPSCRGRVGVTDSSGGRQFGALDVVWAKCRGSPWYPAIIVDPSASEGYSHNGVPVPLPPESVLKAHKTAGSDDSSRADFLVLFFDTKRTWQWLPSQKLQLLGGSIDVDRERLKEAKKSKMKTSVILAYRRAVEHLCKVYGRPYPYPDCGKATEFSVFTL